MCYQIIITDKYKKLQERWLLKQSILLRDKYYATLEMLELNPFHNSLRLHKLRGWLEGCYSVSINMKERIIIDFIIEDKKIILLEVGNHSLYDKR